LGEKIENIIIINNAFSLRWLKYLIRSLTIQKCIENFLIILIDYGNDLLDLINIVKQGNLNVILISQRGKDLGSANQRNLGALFAINIINNFKYILFIDSDIVFLNTNILCKLNNLTKKLKILGFSHVLFNFNNTVQWCCAQLLGPLLFEFKTIKKRGTDFLHGAFLSLNYEAVYEIYSTRKYIFPPFFFIGFDDYLLSLELRKKYRLGRRDTFPVFNLGKILHIGGSTTPRISERRLREAMKNLFLCFILSNNKIRLIGIIPEYMVFSILRNMLNGKLNIFTALKSLVQGLVDGILYWHQVKLKHSVYIS